MTEKRIYYDKIHMWHHESFRILSKKLENVALFFRNVYLLNFFLKSEEVKVYYK